MPRPTDDANLHFEVAMRWANNTLGKASQGADRGQIMVMYEIAAGLRDLAVGLRATYMLLEEVKTSLASRSK